MHRKEKIKRGSYTVEAAIWVPVFLFIMAFAIGAGIKLYGEMEQQGDAGKEIWAVEQFYQRQILEEVLDE